MSQPRPQQSDGSRVVQVRILPPVSTEPGPFEDLIPLKPEEARVLFAFANRHLFPQAEPAQPQDQ